MGMGDVDADARPTVLFVQAVVITSTVDTLSETHFSLEGLFPRLGLVLFDENPACDPLWVIGGSRPNRRLIQFKRDVADVVRANGREVSLSLCHGADTGAHLPNPPTKYIAWIS